MAEPTPAPAPDPNQPSAQTDDGPSDAARQTLKDLVKEAVNEILDERSPDPEKTRKPRPNVFADIWNFGAKS